MAATVRLTMMKDGVRSIVQGMAFGLYLPGIELFLDFRLHEPLSDERQMFFEAIDCLRPDDVLLMDRGFPCRWLVSALTARQLHFCIRCDLSRGFKVVREFLRSGQSEQVVVLGAPNARDAEDYECPATPTTVRLVRVATPNGRMHVVMTSLLDPVAFPAAAFADLYHGGGGSRRHTNGSSTGCNWSIPPACLGTRRARTSAPRRSSTTSMRWPPMSPRMAHRPGIDLQDQPHPGDRQDQATDRPLAFGCNSPPLAASNRSSRKSR
jgi:hypothetical protein